MKRYRFSAFLLALALTAGLLSPLPALAGEGDPVVPSMTVKSTAALLVDGDHDEVIYQQNAHEKRYPASITKVMTALLTLEAVDQGTLALTDVVTVSETSTRDLSEFGSTQDIKPGEQMTVNDLLHCLLITSANEAANILGEAVAGDLDSFIALMNERAAALGCEGTHFANCHGLHRDDHYTTASDIYLFTKEAMKHPLFRELVAMKEYKVPATNLHAERSLHATNALVSTFRATGYYYKYALGIKTGSTPEAGQCLVSAAEKDGKILYAVVLGAEHVKDAEGVIIDRQAFSESSRLLEWGFENFTRLEILNSTYFAGEIPVTLSAQADYVGMAPQGTLESTLPKGLDPQKFDKTVTLTAESLTAPVAEGQTLGEVTVSYEGRVYGKLPLVAVADVERSELLYRLDQVGRFFDQLWVKLLLVVFAFVLAFFLLRWLIFSKRRRYGARGAPRKSGYGGKRRR